MKLVLILGVVVIGLVVVFGCRASPQDTARLVRPAVVALTVLVLVGIAILLADPQDIPAVLETVLTALA